MRALSSILKDFLRKQKAFYREQEISRIAEIDKNLKIDTKLHLDDVIEKIL